MYAFNSSNTTFKNKGKTQSPLLLIQNPKQSFLTFSTRYFNHTKNKNKNKALETTKTIKNKTKKQKHIAEAKKPQQSQKT
jgi:hypothetical protein